MFKRLIKHSWIGLILIPCFAYSITMIGFGNYSTPTYGVLIDTATTEYISVADNAKFTWTPVSQNRSFAAHIKSTALPNSSGEELTVFAFLTAAGNHFVITIEYDDAVYLKAEVFNNAWESQGYVKSADITVANNESHFYTFLLGSGSTCNFYVDGVAYAPTYSSWDDTTSINPDYIYIGKSTLNDNYRIANLTWHDVLLAQEDVYALMYHPDYFDADANCLLSLHMQENTGTNVDDATTAAETDGTMTNCTWTAW